tara:strand:+ start:94 stop:405 length:312 start_codon:yes stop_codon:yes gene_type:complete
MEQKYEYGRLWSEIRNYRVIEVKYLGATNTLGSRVKLTEENNTGKSNDSVIIPFDYYYPCIGEMAYNYLRMRGFNIVCKVCLSNKDLILVDNWGNDFVYLKDE